jgi:hypothetical protein
VATENMKIWDSVKATDPKFTKQVAFGRKFTAIDPTWQLQQATKLWGPYGGEWGLRNISYDIVKSIAWDKEAKQEFTETSLVFAGEFYYPGGKFPILVDEKFKAGDDGLKKIMTSARSKALSYLGFSADVFMGKFDDADYLKVAKVRFADADAFGRSAIARIKTAASKAQLAEQKTKIEQMVADDIINGDVGADLFEEIESRLAELEL